MKIIIKDKMFTDKIEKINLVLFFVSLFILIATFIFAGIVDFGGFSSDHFTRLIFVKIVKYSLISTIATAAVALIILFIEFLTVSIKKSL